MAAGAGDDCLLQDCSGNTDLADLSSSKNECNSSAACGECEVAEKDSNQMEGSEASFSTADVPAAGTSKESVAFKVIFNKQKHDVEFDLDKTIGDVKTGIEKIIGVPASMQKIMFKGLAKDEMTLEELKVTKGAKMMVVGSTLTDVLSVSAPSSDSKDDAKEAASSKEPLSEQKIHKKVLEKYGKPDDAMPGIQGKKLPLPAHPISGMYNKSGGKVRLTFKLELDQVWIGTKERTDKIPMNSIKTIVNEALEGNEDYHMLGLQLGTTEASRYWIYWVPAQYAESIKDAILGKWQYF